MNTYRNDQRPSQTDLKHYWISPRAGDYHRANPKPPTPAMQLGTLTHSLVLEGESALAKYRTDSPVNDKTGEPFGTATKKYAEWVASLPEGHEPANLTQIAQARMMAQAMTDEAREIIKACTHIEQPLFWEQDGIQMKGKPDGWCEEYLIEVKTTSKPLTHRALQGEFMGRLYDLQCAAYCNATMCDKVAIIWLTVANGGDCAVTWLDTAWLDHGREQLARAIANYKQSGSGIGQSSRSFTLELPAWAGGTDELVMETEDE